MVLLITVVKHQNDLHLASVKAHYQTLIRGAGNEIACNLSPLKAKPPHTPLTILSYFYIVRVELWPCGCPGRGGGGCDGRGPAPGGPAWGGGAPGAAGGSGPKAWGGGAPPGPGIMWGGRKYGIPNGVYPGIAGGGNAVYAGAPVPPLLVPMLPPPPPMGGIGWGGLDEGAGGAVWEDVMGGIWDDTTEVVGATDCYTSIVCAHMNHHSLVYPRKVGKGSKEFHSAPNWWQLVWIDLIMCQHNLTRVNHMKPITPINR